MRSIAIAILTSATAFFAILSGLSFLAMASNLLITPALVSLGLTGLFGWFTYKFTQLLET